MSVCGKLLRFDLVFLAGTEQVVQEGHVQLQHFDELDDAAIGDVEFAVEVEGPRIAVAAVFGDLAIVDVAGQFGRILVLFVLRLERADADAVLFAEDDAFDADFVDDLGPIAAVLLQPLGILIAAVGAEVAANFHLVRRRCPDPEFSCCSHLVAKLLGNQVQGSSCIGHQCTTSRRPRRASPTCRVHPRRVSE